MDTVYGNTIGPPGPNGWKGARMQALGVSIKYPPKKGDGLEGGWKVRKVSVPLFRNKVTALMGPSGCGKSTLLKVFNNMHAVDPRIVIEGKVLLDDESVLDAAYDVTLLRARVGMVFQQSNPFPKSIFENVAYGPRIHGLAGSKTDLESIVEKSLMRAGLWTEVKDRLREPGTELSGGQKQRLCIARAIAINPEVILMDEPCSALDKKSTGRVEELIEELAADYTIAIVTHNEHQAARIADFIGYMEDGELVEFDVAEVMMMTPATQAVQSFITGRL